MDIVNIDGKMLLGLDRIDLEVFFIDKVDKKRNWIEIWMEYENHLQVQKHILDVASIQIHFRRP